jgi:hypothetical protein
MKNSVLCICLLAATAIGPVSVLHAGDMEQNLVARWTFKDGSLRSDVGDFEFQEGGRGSLEAGNGTVTLPDRKFLFCPDISSSALPDLQKSITIWARVKFDELPKEGELGVMSLQTGLEAGSWSALVLAMLYRSMAEDPAHAGLAFIGRPQGTNELGVGVSRFQPVSAGEFINIAIVFNGKTQTAGVWTSSTGQWVESRLPGAELLQEFGAFMIGKMVMPGAGTPVTYDEVRVYSTALDPQWLEEITAEKN